MGSFTFHRILPINLVFLVSPDISTEETSSDTIVKEGQDAILTCKATGRPMPQITWRKEDGQSFVVKEGKSKRKGKEFETSNSTNIEMNNTRIFRVSISIYSSIMCYFQCLSIEGKYCNCIEFAVKTWVRLCVLRATMCLQQLAEECH